MTFNFHHLKVDYPNGEKWTKADFDFLKLERNLIRMASGNDIKAGDGMRCSGVIMISHGSFRGLAMIGKYHTMNRQKCWQQPSI